MSIERIFTRPKGAALQLEHERVRVVAGKGIEGDRYFGRADEPGQNVTFTFTASTAGVHTYRCTYHPPSMVGWLTVLG